jgi:hypothetical protein
MTETSPLGNSDNINGFFIFISRSTSEIHTRESAKFLANMHQFLPQMGRNKRNQGYIAGLRG